MSQINLTAIVKSLPEKMEETKATLQEMVFYSIKEKACLKYELHQSQTEPYVFIFHEIWKSREDLDLHNKQPYITGFIEKSTELLQEPVSVYITDII
ncbi:antibiotic biosynthesis monooxygenase [Flavobacterium rakeshii]|uniref:Antibiotic biosynthesis monooxygenase n=1 Tax=Flavobacterium rakeshii TaxID=1038845 RepID=A0A6N8HH90_9FLAO|nr:putative quinol monooxygenase [Flavobacterium rakeshii]MUV05026.1 antibiotic biosynthesis monooxygenase [Flavobacterium rakeshii]